tara:strand:- start:4069 stop:4302 length:234 start_codon:yes stop_codon:yes gene_type:complete
MEFLSNNWEVILATLACAVGGIAVPGVRTFVMIGVRSMVSEKVLTQLAVSALEKAAKSSKNTVDDAFVAELKSRTGR